MLASYETATFTVLYRGYDIEVSRAPSGWRASVYPRSVDLPILRRGPGPRFLLSAPLG